MGRFFKKKEPANNAATGESAYSEPVKSAPSTDSERYPEAAKILDEICPQLQSGITGAPNNYLFHVAGRAYMILSELSSEEKQLRELIKTICVEPASLCGHAIESAYAFGIDPTIQALTTIKESELPQEYLMSAAQLKALAISDNDMKKIYDIAGGACLKKYTPLYPLIISENFARGIKQIATNENVREIMDATPDYLLRFCITCIAGQPTSGDETRNMPATLNTILPYLRETYDLEQKRNALLGGIVDVDAIIYGIS